MSFKSYAVQLIQLGNNAPTANELENTIGSAVWSWASYGNYTLTCNGAFPKDKTYIPPFTDWNGAITTWVPVWGASGDAIHGYFTINWTDEDRLTLIFTDADGNYTDMSILMPNSTLYLPEIKVYQ